MHTFESCTGYRGTILPEDILVPIIDPDKRRECSRVYNPEFRERIRESNRKSLKKLDEQRSDLLAEFRSNGCIHCGEKEPCCLDAHHRDASQKEFTISTARRSVGIEKIRAELSKCDCVCRNCHAKIHSGLITDTP